MTEAHENPDLDHEITEAVLGVLRRRIPQFVNGAGIEHLVVAVRSDDDSAAERNITVTTASPQQALSLLNVSASWLLEAAAAAATTDDSAGQDDRGDAVSENVEEETVVGAVRIDTASLLMVDPGHLPPELVSRLLSEQDDGLPAPGLLLSLIGDGEYQVVSTPDGIEVLDPYGDEGYPHSAFTREEWSRLTGPAACPED